MLVFPGHGKVSARCGSPGSGHRFAELEPFIEGRSLDGVRLPLLGLAGLLLTKEGMRDKDRADRRVIEQALAALEGSD